MSEKTPHRRPATFKLGDPGVIVMGPDETGRPARGTVHITPEAEPTTLPVPIEAPLVPARSGFRWGTLFWCAVGGLVLVLTSPRRTVPARATTSLAFRGDGRTNMLTWRGTTKPRRRLRERYVAALVAREDIDSQLLRARLLAAERHPDAFEAARRVTEQAVVLGARRTAAAALRIAERAAGEDLDRIALLEPLQQRVERVIAQ